MKENRDNGCEWWMEAAQICRDDGRGSEKSRPQRRLRMVDGGRRRQGTATTAEDGGCPDPPRRRQRKREKLESWGGRLEGWPRWANGAAATRRRQRKLIKAGLDVNPNPNLLCYHVTNLD
jgi:hypothetical protein